MSNKNIKNITNWLREKILELDHLSKEKRIQNLKDIEKELKTYSSEDINQILNSLKYQIGTTKLHSWEMLFKLREHYIKYDESIQIYAEFLYNLYQKDVKTHLAEQVEEISEEDDMLMCELAELNYLYQKIEECKDEKIEEIIENLKNKNELENFIRDAELEGFVNVLHFKEYYEELYECFMVGFEERARKVALNHLDENEKVVIETIFQYDLRNPKFSMKEVIEEEGDLYSAFYKKYETTLPEWAREKKEEKKTNQIKELCQATSQLSSFYDSSKELFNLLKPTVYSPRISFPPTIEAQRYYKKMEEDYQKFTPEEKEVYRGVKESMLDVVMQFFDLYEEAIEDHPVIAALDNEKIIERIKNIADCIYKEWPGEYYVSKLLTKEIKNLLSDTLKDIQNTRRNIINNKVKIWELEIIVYETLMTLACDANRYDVESAETWRQSFGIIFQLVYAKLEKAKNTKVTIDLTLNVFAYGLALASMICPKALPGIIGLKIALVFIFADLLLSCIIFSRTLRDFLYLSPATNTHFLKAQALTTDAPGVLCLVFDALSIVLDVYDVYRGIKEINNCIKLLKKFDKLDFAEDIRATLKKFLKAITSDEAKIECAILEIQRKSHILKFLNKSSVGELTTFFKITESQLTSAKYGNLIILYESLDQPTKKFLLKEGQIYKKQLLDLAEISVSSLETHKFSCKFFKALASSDEEIAKSLLQGYFHKLEPNNIQKLFKTANNLNIEINEIKEIVNSLGKLEKKSMTLITKGFKKKFFNLFANKIFFSRKTVEYLPHLDGLPPAMKKAVRIAWYQKPWTMEAEELANDVLKINYIVKGKGNDYTVILNHIKSAGKEGIREKVVLYVKDWNWITDIGRKALFNHIKELEQEYLKQKLHIFQKKVTEEKKTTYEDRYYKEKKIYPVSLSGKLDTFFKYKKKLGDKITDEDIITWLKKENLLHDGTIIQHLIPLRIRNILRRYNFDFDDPIFCRAILPTIYNDIHRNIFYRVQESLLEKLLGSKTLKKLSIAQKEFRDLAKGFDGKLLKEIHQIYKQLDLYIFWAKNELQKYENPQSHEDETNKENLTKYLEQFESAKGYLTKNYPNNTRDLTEIFMYGGYLGNKKREI